MFHYLPYSAWENGSWAELHGQPNKVNPTQGRDHQCQPVKVLNVLHSAKISAKGSASDELVLCPLTPSVLTQPSDWNDADVDSRCSSSTSSISPQQGRATARRAPSIAPHSRRGAKADTTRIRGGRCEIHAILVCVSSKIRVEIASSTG